MADPKRRPAHRRLSGATATTVMGWGLYRYVDPWLFEEEPTVDPGPSPFVPKPRVEIKP